MSPANEGVYIIPEDGDGDDEAGAWVAPEPAEDVIVDEILAETDLARDTVEPLTDYVDLETLDTVLSGDGDGPCTFDVEGHTVSVTADGEVSVNGN
jgi:hypothetical protein